MQPALHARAQQSLGILELGVVDADRDAVFVRLLDNGAVEFGRQRLHAPVAVVDPDLDEFRLDAGVVGDRRPYLVDG